MSAQTLQRLAQSAKKDEFAVALQILGYLAYSPRSRARVTAVDADSSHNLLLQILEDMHLLAKQHFQTPETTRSHCPVDQSEHVQDLIACVSMKRECWQPIRPCSDARSIACRALQYVAVQ